MWVRLFGLLFGFFKVSIYCKSAEKLLDLFIVSNITVSKIVKKSKNEIEFECGFKALRNIKALKDDNIQKIDYEKHGIPLFLHDNKKRMGILISIIVFSALFYYISLHIWHIDIIGCESMNKYEVLDILEKCEFKIGSLKSEVDPSKIENDVLYLTDKLSWMSINIKGTMAVVEVRENMRKVKRLDTSEPSNIYASRDGIIDSVKAYMGYPVVKKGDTVTTGELLITGEYTDKYEKQYRLHSYGEVMAYTVHSFDVTIPFRVTEQQKTGKSKKYFKISTTRFSIPLYFNKKILYNNYSKTNSINKIKLFDSFYLPISIEKETYYETDIIQYSISKDAALDDAYQKLNEKALSLVGVEIVDRKYVVSENENELKVKLILDCYEDICFEKNM